MADDIQSQLAPTGTLRAGINLGNMHLVTGEAANGDPEGVAPDMARAIADKIGVGVTYVTFASPGELADGAKTDAWDIGLIAADPTRAETIDFTAAYVEIEATYMVRDDSPFQTIADVDQPGVRIAISGRSAYDLYLTRALKHAELVRAEGGPAAAQLFVDENLDALAALRPSLATEAKGVENVRIIPGNYTTAQQAVGAQQGNPAALAFLREFVEGAKSSGLVAQFIEKHGVSERLAVAPPS